MPPKILFVDDEPDVELLIRQLYRRKLRNGELETLFAASGVEALEVLAANQDIVAVFTDINMPRMDGLTLLAEIQKLPGEIPVVMVSAYGDRQNVRAAMNRGAFDFVTKPVDLADLEATRQKVMRHVEDIVAEGDPAEVARTPAQADVGAGDAPTSAPDTPAGADRNVVAPPSAIEVAAGLAHEIRNPLNFILNFSRLSTQLVRELRQSLVSARERLGDQAPSMEELVGLIEANLAKIGEHGSWAESIMSSMLERARGVSGTTEPTGIHELLDAQVALAREGARFRYPDLDVAVSRNYAADMPEVALDRLSVARALLVVFNNAYDAVAERQASGGDAYRPELMIRTNVRSDAVEIRIRDNGPGIAEADVARIFLPGFSTKRQRLGVGLGLALSYDVIVTQHRGALFVESKEGEFAEFVVILPLGRPERPHETEQA